MTERVSLDEGFFQELFESNEQSDLQPTLQISRARAVDNSGTNCLRLQLSDGIFTYTGCAMGMNLENQLKRDGLKREILASDPTFPVIQLIKFVCKFGEKKSILITEYKLISPGVPKIGSPRVHNGDPEAFRGMLAAKKRLNANVQSGSPSPSSIKRLKLGGSSAVLGIVPFAALNPYMAVGRWKIKGVVVKKESLHEFPSKIGRGPSKVFGFEMADETGQFIKLSAFGETAERFHPQLDENSTYYISGNSMCIKGANKRYNNTGLDYEISLNADCTIEKANDKIEKPKISLRTVPLDQLASHNNQSVDILAIIERTEDCQTVMSRDQRELKRRNVHLIDKGGVVTILTLWGIEAEKFNVESESVIAIKGAYVKEFQGNYSLAINSSTIIEVNPEGKEYSEMLHWYERERPNMEVKFASSSGASNNLVDELRSIFCVKHSSMYSDSGEKGAYFNLVGYITNIHPETALYPSCTKCQKKVQENDGIYHCEKCGTTSKECKYRYLLAVEFTDDTGSTYLTFFDDKATQLFGKTADEMNELRQKSPNDYDMILKSKVFLLMNLRKVFLLMNIRCRGRMETYQDQTRVKITVYDIRPLNYAQYTQALEAAVKFMENLSIPT
uniref:Replication protein A subunit n=1 Tax=Panagrolaimus sp. JU765 TaxID=591449 RepID=A0AC34QQW4_9BILA